MAWYQSDLQAAVNAEDWAKVKIIVSGIVIRVPVLPVEKGGKLCFYLFKMVFKTELTYMSVPERLCATAHVFSCVLVYRELFIYLRLSLVRCFCAN